MVQVRAIRSEEDYEAALARISELMDALSGHERQMEDPDDPRRVELEVLVDLVEFYESRSDNWGLPNPVSAIEFRMEQANLTQRDLVPFIGSRAKVSEILSGKRRITMSMARALHQHLGIPAAVLLQESGATFQDNEPDLEYSRFPLRAMAKVGWIPNVRSLKDHAEELITDLREQAGVRHTATALYRKNDNRRINAKTDDYALRAWCWKVLAQSREKPLPAQYEDGTVDQDFLRQIAQLSTLADGPVRARDFLAEHGIGFEYVKHLPRTHLDGAVLHLPGDSPVIGMTLRYDRIDNFWFTLLHELGHLGLHLGRCGDETGFVDDLSLRDVEAGTGDADELEADDWAQDALIPPDVWDNGVILENPAPMAVMQMAWDARVNPAVVAGRVRHERGEYRLLSQFVGTGEVRRQLEDIPR